MKTIRGKIILAIIACVTIALVVVGVSSIVLTLYSTNSTLEQTMAETATIAATQIRYELESYKNVATETGCIPILSSETATVSEKKEAVDQRVKAYDFQRGNVVLANGTSIFDGNDYSDRDYFKVSMKGETFFSEPLVSKVTGELSIIISAPLWKDGEVGGTIYGVIYFVPKETFLNDIVTAINVSPGGGAYILNKTGVTIAHKNIENVANQESTIEDAKTDKDLTALADIETKMINGEEGFGTYSYAGVKKFLSYAPIANTDGWSIGINAPTSDFMSATIISVVITIVLLVLAVIASTIVAISIAKKLSLPIKQCADRLSLLAEGDLKSLVPSCNAKDETGILLTSLSKTVDGLNSMVGDVEHNLSYLAKGNFDVSPTVDFKGDFIALRDSLVKITSSLSETLGEINIASEQVFAGAEQVSSGAQALSQGATEQASSVEELAATINEISGQIAQTAAHAIQASENVSAVGSEAVESNNRMSDMLSAMTDISNSSSEIGKIIKTIEDIAFQTNILALNAAVEAARAGAAGKGFAVVADEVRNLASKSAQASKNTAELIVGSIQAVENGTKIAGETATSLNVVVEGVRGVADTINKISSASKEQAESIAQITTGIDQISAVVQTNSATAEQSAAASEELNGQANLLKDRVSEFVLKKNDREKNYLDQYMAN